MTKYLAADLKYNFICQGGDSQIVLITTIF